MGRAVQGQAGAGNARQPRSYLYVPGDRHDRLARALARGADALILDLEDSVVPQRKEAARQTVRDWLDEQAGAATELWVRINADSAVADLNAVATSALTGVVVAKASPSLVNDIDMLLAPRERDLGRASDEIRLIPLIESARGLLSVVEIAAAPRVARLGVGLADLRAELGLHPDSAGVTPLLMQIVVASAAAGIAPPVAPTSLDFRDPESLRTSSRALLGLGFRARSAIHPAQLSVINEVFTPTAEEIEEARRIVAELEHATESGSGVVAASDGSMLDVAIVRAARDVLARAQASSVS